jgi:hypothetical protein
VNSFTATPLDWTLLNYPPAGGSMQHANGYVTFCPGLDKAPTVVANYDVAWAPGPGGPFAREAGAMRDVFDDPMWLPTWTDPNTQKTWEPFLLDNELDPSRYKHIELLVDFYGRDSNYVNEDILLYFVDGQGIEQFMSPSSAVLSDDDGQVLFTWALDTQPAWEEILFPSFHDYYMLEGKVASWDVAVICNVPEPATVGLLALGATALVARRRRR